jgi:transposase InsO family protein
VIVSEGFPAQAACRILGVSESGYYARRGRPLSARAIRHVWLTDLIRQIHTASRGTYGARRIHAELTMGYGVAVGHNAVEMLMSRAGIAGLPGNRRRKRKIPGAPTALDLVDRHFTRTEPYQLWVTDIERHEAPLNRVVLKGHHVVPVAAGVNKLRAA